MSGEIRVIAVPRTKYRDASTVVGVLLRIAAARREQEQQQ